ncbi:isochorismate synthase / 2-succinyl-5-enolpyruvyl-6-hydroxy-3-cyclohexene-1-carboxylate synthase / 2-succinyl-6-hydroxy-2,4-cyclohexadiene-1-carboxylate synthase / O-succinylbenzoate synthase [Apostasia shenzhenica]|uniref:Isochorismate synthase / 2-succinyl-5-enolpyruvyl-6-hydroxy-3-cyclohexene-1-carboxylate synthase / 2-succinyl-6-hydroxy-2,4-cyclohexadiene-1-carboxylate synthase / O-succinylbenzoate synthase n=1 Tax=Apostasia shenzhenica TaxID=1088818 RepID=A0A2H9ZV94_9ASPA|nr:isochorismate synthase / 2-succinyl-5-enolpyruvyl-6-hydroxy-3-cyclohexene-1-carboxylate synthase / 2-succinyl-6-hydroxy-2,4-cyclohexadiene-1-carboxylate synthase / O-succinylbenzoate synthase [Apostasia shenzhenica]
MITIALKLLTSNKQQPPCRQYMIINPLAITAAFANINPNPNSQAAIFLLIRRESEGEKMVNWVEAQKPLLHGLVKMAGLRQLTVEIEPGTSMSFWVPKDKLPKTKNTTKEVFPVGKTGSVSGANKKEKPVVVLIHGFAAEGIVTWQFQVGALTSRYAVYVPDLLFFGGSVSTSADRSPEFQAHCLAMALGRLGVARCTVVGFSYGGMVAFSMAAARPELVEAIVVSGSIIAMTDSISTETMERLGFSSSKELLLPQTVKGLKALFKVATYKKLWLPERLFKDYLKVMFNNRKERAELLEALINSSKEANVPVFRQRILLLWGENDNLFNVGLAKDMKEQLGEIATLQPVKKAGHLVHLERPCVYNRQLKQFLALVNSSSENKI